ncbi:MAG: hypothetical protein UY72_C0016G0002 [Candidatus Uhrbacteria bacterium GW2011_GWD2_52_7]|uniref:Uncharacterized protein n=1 Tax=Candidatus Uhrbacteria bacterium GW2011_GWD2_52_7 TaxID=1618989 RepID=A0A0G2ACV7_9BACT|nr:MAG: hypothetical protein UY72_C0016G0002 [Candidatus Uhrbacteria bacterium GW2011_GWD2_52_7]
MSDQKGRQGSLDPNFRGALPGGPPLMSDNAARRLRNDRPHVDRSMAAMALSIRARGIRENILSGGQEELDAAFLALLTKVSAEVPAEFEYDGWRIVHLTFTPLQLFTSECRIIFENDSGDRINCADERFPPLIEVAKAGFFRQTTETKYTFVFTVE